MTRTLDAAELQDLLAGLFQPGALKELGVLALCLALAWLLVRLVRGGEPLVDASIWFGRRIVDGVLFPLAALALAFGAKLLLASVVKAAVFKLAVPILMSLVVIRLTVRVLTATYPESRWMRIIERSISWIAWLAAVLWVTGVLPLLLDAMDEVRWKLGTSEITLRNFVEGALTAGLVMVLALSVAAAIEKRLLRGTGSDLSIRKMAANIVRALLLFVGLMLALSAVGIDLTALSVLGGAIGVGLGFGLQKIAANYISGFVILAERSLRIGDMVRVDNFDGRITDIRTRYTVIRALNGREAIVPNEMLITQRVENSSLADPRVLVTTNVQVAYGTDVRALQPLIVLAVSQVSRVLPDPLPTMHLIEFAADGMNIAVNFWILDPENGQGNVRSEVNLALLSLLNEHGIEIPYPQRVLRRHPPLSGPRLHET
ncbi:MAG: mechanosensitive ion channel [Pseudomonadota bacterium]|nr:mechanosensitive ion channel [Pseudomonadota bacterium]